MSLKAVTSFFLSLVAPLFVIGAIWIGTVFQTQLTFVSLFIIGVACLAMALSWGHEALDDTGEGRKTGGGIALVALVLGYLEVIGFIGAIFWMFTVASGGAISSGMLWVTAILALIVVFALLMTLSDKEKTRIRRSIALSENEEQRG